MKDKYASLIEGKCFFHPRFHIPVQDNLSFLFYHSHFLLQISRTSVSSVRIAILWHGLFPHKRSWRRHLSHFINVILLLLFLLFRFVFRLFSCLWLGFLCKMLENITLCLWILSSKNLVGITVVHLVLMESSYFDLI